MSDTTSSPWLKATASNSDNCVEMRRHVSMVEVRDTKDRGTGPILRLTPAEMATWLAGAKRGEFDGLG